MFDISACHVERMPDHSYLVRWRTLSPGRTVAVYMADNPDRYYGGGDPGEAIVTTTGTEALVANPDRNVRHYFYLLSDRGEGVVLAERKLALEGTPNFRDLGGYQAGDGRRLKWGKLYRSSKLSGLTAPDMNYVHRLGLTLICDFRQVLEQELEPTVLAEGNPAQVASLPIAPGSAHNFLENLHNGIIAVENASDFMQEINRDFVASQMPRYAEMFQLLLVGDQQVLIHCASGKDRTGFGAALILDVLGVDEEAIVADYLLTNNYLPLEQEMQRLSSAFSDQSGAAVSAEVLRPMLEVRPEYIRACFDEIKKRYESKEHFYQSALRLGRDDLERLKDRYLH